MNIEKRNITDLIPNAQNVRKHTKNQIDEFKKSVDKFGVIRPIVIDENNVILAGHGLFETLKQQGKDEVEVMVINGLSEKDKKKLLLSDNKIYSLGVDDYSVIEDLLAELGTENDFEIPGYNSEILEELYGIKSVQQDASITDTPEKQITQEAEKNIPIVKTLNTPNDKLISKVSEAREQNERKFVICQNCGEKIWL